MTTLFALIWLTTLIAIPFWGTKFVKFKIDEKKSKGIKGIKFKLKNIFKAKENQTKNSKYTGKQLKTFFIISIVVSFVSFIGIGVTVLPTEQTNNDNTITYENNSNKSDNTTENDEKLPETGKETEEIGNDTSTEKNEVKDFNQIKQQALSSIPAYTNKPYVAVNNNEPFFNDIDLTIISYESYSELDNLKRCGIAMASIGKDIMPTEERGSIGNVKPTGWHSVRYKGIDGNYLYNRCHLIGYQLTAENANEKNLITGTRYMNVDGMLPFENMVADYVKETGNHVLYRVTPIFQGDNLLVSGVLMEAKSVEDNGKGIQFNVYCYNVQPGIEINYATGESSGPEYTETASSGDGGSSSTNIKDNSINSSTNDTTSNNAPVVTPSSNSNNSTTGTATTTKPEPPTNNNTIAQTYILNTNTKKFHEPSCGSAKRIKESNKSTFLGTRDEIISRGYSPCGNCDP